MWLRARRPLRDKWVKVPLADAEQLPPLLADDTETEGADVLGRVPCTVGSVAQYMDRPSK